MLNMNEFSAKKLGEVFAFANISLNTAEKSKEALKETFGDELFTQIIDKNKKHIELINSIAINNNVQNIVNKKLEGTSKKLTEMRNLYIGDQWDNPIELLEWSGFFEGAAIVHWKLVSGVGKSLQKEEIITLSEEALYLHNELFEKAKEKLEEYGKNKAL